MEEKRRWMEELFHSPTINGTGYNKSQASRKNRTETNTKFQGRRDLCFKNRAMCFGRNAVCLVLFITC